MTPAILESNRLIQRSIAAFARGDRAEAARLHKLASRLYMAERKRLAERATLTETA
jgi:hypothetical protein